MSPWRVVGPAAGYENGALKGALFPSEFPPKHERDLPVRPAGAGKNFFPQALGYLAIRTGHTVPVIIGDLGRYRLTAHQSVGIYEFILNRHWYYDFVIIVNWAVDEWVSLFDNPILATTVLGALIGDAGSVRNAPRRSFVEQC